MEQIVSEVFDKLPQVAAAFTSPRLAHEEKLLMLDKAFGGAGGDGIVRFPTALQNVQSVRLTPDGKILLAGTSWSEFTPNHAPRSPEEPLAILSEGSVDLRLTPEAVRLLGGAKTVRLFFDRTGQRVGLKAAEEGDPATYPLKRYGGSRLFHVNMQSFRKWADTAPDGFKFAVKAWQFATAKRDLAEGAPLIEKFLASDFTELGDKLGPILWQFAPFKPFEADDFAAFLRLLPHEIAGRGLRHVVEVRHPSFRTPDFIDLLRQHRIAVAQVDDAKHPAFDELTADFAYLRLHCCAEEEPTGYPPDALDDWAERLQGWTAEGRDCFLYFINGAKVRAPAAAEALLQRLAT